MQVVGLSDIGLVRKRNEDSFLIKPEEGIFIVCDGMGGHKGGNIASALAVQTIENYINNHPYISVEVLNEAIDKANQKIYLKGHDNPEWHEMGTTVTIARIDDLHMNICHVGDSRAYLIRENEIKQVTKDHTLAEEMLESGIINNGQKSYNHILTRALGISETIEIDNIALDLCVGDHILLCSDGLSDMLNDQEILDIILKNKDTAVIAENLLQEALNNGGKDNITIILVGISGR